MGDRPRALKMLVISHFSRLGLSVVLAFWLSSASAPAAFAQTGTGTLRVDGANGVDAGGCGSAVSPCRRIQYAVNLASSGDEILVAKGTYTYDVALDTLCTANVSKTGVVCILNKELEIIGGYDGVAWTTPNPNANLTTIDGENTYRGVLVMKTSPTAAEASLRLEGFTLTRALALGADSGGDSKTFAFGGGLSATLADVILRDLVFSSNSAVGGDTTDADHAGAGAGGGVAIRGSAEDRSQATIERVRFEDNTAQGGVGIVRGGLGIGGGLFTNTTDLTANDLIFTSNHALGGSSTGDGAVNGLRADAQGGAIGFQNFTVAVVTGVEATGNEAVGGDAGNLAGGAFGGAFFGERSDLTLRQVSASGNEARGGDGTEGYIGAGGAMMTTRTTVDLAQIEFLNNLASGGDGPSRKGSGGGGGGYFSRPDGTTTVTIRNSIIADNVVLLGTGGGNVGGGGGGVFLIGADLTMSHVTLAGNRLGSLPLQGIAMVLVDGGATGSSVADIDHTIIADHTEYDGNVVAVNVQVNSTANFDTGLFAGNDEDTNDDGTPAKGTINGLGSMLSAVSAGFLSPGSPNFDYHIIESSAAVDSAAGSTETVDFELQTRDGSPDIGADELGALPLFADGFESGDTSRWSNTIGG